jgi:hypothetical protein
MANTPNHICKICGEKYYACEGCDQRNHWKSVTCSPECFKEWMRIIDERDNPKPVEVEKPVEIIKEDVEEEVVEKIEEIIEQPMKTSTKKSK